MIQRIQTLYLSLAATLSVFLFFTDIVFKISANPTEKVSYKMDLEKVSKINQTNVVETIETTPINAGLNILVLACVLFCILQFKKRHLQMKLCRLLLMLILILVVLIFYQTDRVFPAETATYKTIYWVGAYIPVIQLILIYLARLSIKKDEELVRSVDRIR
jgi:glucan phosphoethanolaminetransferase (alkaline phosphatase superfamily)